MQLHDIDAIMLTAQMLQNNKGVQHCELFLMPVNFVCRSLQEILLSLYVFC